MTWYNIQLLHNVIYEIYFCIELSSIKLLESKICFNHKAIKAYFISKIVFFIFLEFDLPVFITTIKFLKFKL